MDDGPFAGVFGFDGDGFHRTAADAGAVAGGFVDVPAVETTRAVVAVFGAPAFARDAEFAVDAREALGLVSALAPVIIA